MEKILILFRGVPGAGKTSLCASLGIKAMSADMFFEDMADNGDLVYNFDPTRLKEAHAWCQKHTGVSMEMGVSPVGVANTFTQEWEMKPYFELADKHGYKIFTVIVENRHGSDNIHGVPADKVEVMKGRFNISL